MSKGNAPLSECFRDLRKQVCLNRETAQSFSGQLTALQISGEWKMQVLDHALQAGPSSSVPKQFTLRQGKQELGLKKSLTNLFRNHFASCFLLRACNLYSVCSRWR